MAQPIRVTKGGTFVPSWGNEGRSEKEEIQVHYRFLTFEEQQQLLHHEDIGKNFAYEARMLARMIERIDNLQVEDDSGVREVKTGDELIKEPGLDGLAMELWLHFRQTSALSADQKKS